MFYHELADSSVSFLHFRSPLPSFANSQNFNQIRQLLIHTGGKDDYRKTMGGNTERV